MGFLDRYAKDNALGPIEENIKKRLEKVEKNLDEKTQGDDTFSDMISDYSDRIMAIVDKVKTEFAGWQWSLGNVASAFRFVIDIAGDVTGIVKELEDKIVPDNATPEEAKQAKVQFGQELTYFVYLLWNPRLVKWVPVGIETWVEKKIVYWLAGMAVDWSLDYLDGKTQVDSFAVKTIAKKPRKKNK